MLRDAVAQQEWIQRLEDIVSTHPGANRHSQSLAGVFVQDGQHLVAPTTAELVVHEVDAPDVVRMRGAQPDDRTVLVVKPSPLLVPLRQLKSLFAPDPLNFLVVHLPAFDTQQLGNLAIAVAPILLRQPDQSQPKSLIISPGRLVLQGASRQTDRPACPSLRRRELLTCMNNGLTELLRRQALGFR